MKKISFLLSAIFMLALILSSCGQTGDLYLPKKEIVNSGSKSGSTIATSGSSIKTKNTDKVDNNPSAPEESSDPEATELVDTGDGFGFQKNIMNATNGGDAPV